MKIQEINKGIRFEVFVKTSAQENKIEITNQEIVFFSKKRPHRSMVNKELIKKISKFFGSKVKIVAGSTSNKKILFIDGVNKLDFDQKIKNGQYSKIHLS